MKVVAMYLPQFHEVEENSKWWGEGYTDWVAAKLAEKLYDEHIQPNVPLNNNYYNLLDKNTLIWQTELMSKYGVDGVCFYHYWFKDGKRLLEKPAENLLKWKDINMPFCFSWANCAWARSWSKIKNTSPWAVKFEQVVAKKGIEVLMEQDYGNKTQWKQHFDYLLPFFLDKRYLRLDGKPIFVIYNPALIPCLKDMVSKWRQWAEDAGLEGIYFIGVKCDDYDITILDADLHHEPACLFEFLHAHKKSKEGPAVFDYDEAWNQLLDYKAMENKTYYGGFVSYDDTPRRGGQGLVIQGADPEKFKHYFAELLAKNAVEDNEITFINAWNEWGEGMYLEPDERHGHGYLSAVSYAREHYVNYIKKYEEKQQEKSGWNQYFRLKKLNCKYQAYWRIMDKWLCLKEKGIPVSDYFENKEINSVAIYGMGMLGKHLLNELVNSFLEVKCGIDQNAKMISMNLLIIVPDAEIPRVDAVIVTVVQEFRRIRDIMNEKGITNIFSLEDIIMELSERENV